MKSLHKCSLTLRHIGHTPTNDGFFKLVEALLYTHSCLFSQNINVRGLPLSACHCLAALSTKTSAFNSLMQQNACHRNIKVNLCRFVAMLLLCNKDQQQNNPLATFATHLCRQRRGHEWTASSSLHDTATVNLTLVQCEFHTGNKTVIARIKSINRN